VDKWKGMPMKTSVQSVLFALGAAGLSAAMTLPASAQQFKGRGCDNVSTSRDKTPKPDSRCMLASDERYLQEQNLSAGKSLRSIVIACNLIAIKLT